MYGVRVRIGDVNLKRIVDVDALVDTGTTLTVTPRKLAEKLNLEVTGRTVVETGAGRLELDRSRVWIEIMGKSEIVPVLISDIIDKVLIRSYHTRSTRTPSRPNNRETKRVDNTTILTGH